MGLWTPGAARTVFFVLGAAAELDEGAKGMNELFFVFLTHLLFEPESTLLRFLSLGLQVLSLVVQIYPLLQSKTVPNRRRRRLRQKRKVRRKVKRRRSRRF